uniref:Uncharacterized protein n=1 Tax=Setaria italica TaxID=4555 RepID=K4AJU7_SETIT
MGTLLRPGPAAAAPPIPVTSSSAHVAAVGGGGFGARSSRHRVSVGAFWTPSPQVLETRWRQRRRDTVVVRSDVVAGGAAAAAGDSTQALSVTSPDSPWLLAIEDSVFLLSFKDHMRGGVSSLAFL